MKTKHAKAAESNRNLYIAVLLDRARAIMMTKGRLDGSVRHTDEADINRLRSRLELKTDVELLLMVQVGRELQGA